MVSWSEISSCIHKNSRSELNVPAIRVRSDKCSIPIITATVEPPAAAVKLPPPPAPPAPSVAPAALLIAPAAARAPAPAPAALRERENTGIPRSSKTCVDPIVIGIIENEPLYNSAPRLTKHQMEVAEAQRIESMMNDVYSKESGRSRGWTKTGIEQMIKPRCASGGDIKELERARVSFPWKLIRDDKLASAFLDFICVCKQIRVAVWDDDAKIVALYPAADPCSKPRDTKYPLYHVNVNGELMFGGSDLVKLCDSNKFVLMPPLSVIKSLSGLTLDELASVASQLGMTSVEGNKAERVAAIASFKVRSRIV